MNFKQISDLLTSREPLAPLLPQNIWDAKTSTQISSADDEDLFEKQHLSEEMKAAIRSGLLLLNDDLKASHTLSQKIETPTGSAWHAIMHRREGDFSNAKYWWRNAQAHPAFESIHAAAMSTLSEYDSPNAQSFQEELEKAGTWIPMQFVDACEKAQTDDFSKQNIWLRHLQQVEMKTLLEWCSR